VVNTWFPSPPSLLPRITVVRTWQEANADQLAEQCVVVIDVLRWSTVVVTALANGAEHVEAFATPDDARARAEALGRGRVVLGGERNNRALEGFDVGNSPLEYQPSRVERKIVVTSTTNGTSALVAARAAASVHVAAFVNLSATVTALAAELENGRSVTLLCAGQAGQETLEDTACAGAIVDVLRTGGALRPDGLDDEAERAVREWVTHKRSTEVVMHASRHARALRSEGFGADVSAAASVGVYTFDAVRDASGGIVVREGLRTSANRATSKG
jgi:2-phosphosulfolactate phosphatase